ncbi:hypothetical protein QYM36_004098, partial [Artemia franciscana]
MLALLEAKQVLCKYEKFGLDIDAILEARWKGCGEKKTSSDIMEWDAVGIDCFSTWHNPLGLVENQLPSEQTVLQWRQNQYSIEEECWKKIIEFSWDISLLLTVFLPSRLGNIDVASKE